MVLDIRQLFISTIERQVQGNPELNAENQDAISKFLNAVTLITLDSSTQSEGDLQDTDETEQDIMEQYSIILNSREMLESLGCYNGLVRELLLACNDSTLRTYHLNKECDWLSDEQREKILIEHDFVEVEGIPIKFTDTTNHERIYSGKGGEEHLVTISQWKQISEFIRPKDPRFKKEFLAEAKYNFFTKVVGLRTNINYYVPKGEYRWTITDNKVTSGEFMIMQITKDEGMKFLEPTESIKLDLFYREISETHMDDN